MSKASQTTQDGLAPQCVIMWLPVQSHHKPIMFCYIQSMVAKKGQNTELQIQRQDKWKIYELYLDSLAPL